MNVEKMRQLQAIGNDILDEVEAQDQKWGTGRHFPGTLETGIDNHPVQLFHGVLPEDLAKRAMRRSSFEDRVTWADILTEEVAEAYGAETWPDRRMELVQCLAVITQWIIDGDAS